MSRHHFTRSLLLGCVVAALAASHASAASFKEFGSQFANITTASNNTSEAFGVNFTGQLGLSANSNTTFVGALFDGVFVGNPNGYSLQSLNGHIDFDSGHITGGALSFSVTNGFMTDSFSAQFAYTADAITQLNSSGTLFGIEGNLKNILFSSTGNADTFAGFDISSFMTELGLSGSVFDFKYSGAMVDDTTGLIATAVIPLPPAALIGLTGMGAVFLLRRRRDANGEQ